MQGNQALAELLAQYRIAAAGSDDPDSKRQNKCADAVHAHYKKLRASEAGRDGILELIHDSSLSVRVWAASHSLAWAPQAARAALEDVRDGGVFPHAFTAEMTLEEFDKGNLTFDY